MYKNKTKMKMFKYLVFPFRIVNRFEINESIVLLSSFERRRRRKNFSC